MRETTIREHFDLDPWPADGDYGDIGIEIEMEGDKMEYPPMDPITGQPTTFWYGKHDNSMKGPGLEYYLVHPIKRTQVRTALKQLKQLWKDKGAKPKPTNQDAVHVHMNVRDLSQDKTMTFIMLLVMLEDILVRWCGDEREGNLFCLRTRDAEDFLTFLRNILIKKSFGSGSSYHPNYLKYAAINIAPLAHFGSVEIRCMQTPKDIMVVETWVEMLCSIYDAAMKLSCVRDVVDVLSYSMAEDFLTQIFGEHAHQFMFPDVDQLLFDGRERVKQVIYSAHIYKERKKNKTLIAPPPPRKKGVEYDWVTAGMSVGLGGGNPPVQPEPGDGMQYGLTPFDGFMPAGALVGTVPGTKVKKYKLSASAYFYKTTDGKMYGCQYNLSKTHLKLAFAHSVLGLPDPVPEPVQPLSQPPGTVTWNTAASQWWMDEQPATLTDPPEEP